MKKLVLIAGIVFAGQSVMAQNGLEGIVVEKYYVSNAADSTDAANNSAISPLRVGSVTYRVYANLLPGYKFIQLYGTADHALKVNTTTNFYNDPNYGSTFSQGTTLNNTKKNTTLIDSWFSVGGVCSGKMGVLKTEDTDGSIGNTQNLLANTNPDAGIPITGANSQDGLLPGTPVAPNVLGISSELDIFDQTSGSTFEVTDGAIAALGGVAGVTATNMVLIGQFTTYGKLHFELNIQIGTPVSGESQQYVASNPTGTEISIPTLTYTSPDIINHAGLNENTVADFAVSVFPNPSKGNITIAVNNTADAYTYKVVDVQGSVMASDKVAAGVEAASVDLSHLSGGVYFVNVTKNDVTSTTRIILQ